MDTLNRAQARLPEAIWQAIERAAIEAARARLTGRRFLEVEGPLGVGLTAIEAGNDDYCRQPGPQEADAVMGRRALEDILDRMQDYVDGLKFAGGSFSLMPRNVLAQIIDALGTEKTMFEAADPPAFSAVGRGS
jgi:Encapsulating protein for peroxidase/(2R)-phospho-3-sulfolactate synthase (ComA)